jgi:hypothetical protein
VVPPAAELVVTVGVAVEPETVLALPAVAPVEGDAPKVAFAPWELARRAAAGAAMPAAAAVAMITGEIRDLAKPVIEYVVGCPPAEVWTLAKETFEPFTNL